MRTVLIVHGAPLVRLGLRTLVEAQAGWAPCGETGNPAAALTLAAELKPFAVFVDLVLPGSDGVSLVRDLHRLVPKARLAVVTSLEDTESVQRAFLAGAGAYVTTLDDPAEILAAMEALHAGAQYASRRVSDGLLHELSRGALRRQGDTEVSCLSDREMQIFRMIGRGMSSSAIARELCVSPKTVETHRQRIKDKLQLQNGSQLAQRAACWLVESNKSSRRP